MELIADSFNCILATQSVGRLKSLYVPLPTRDGSVDASLGLRVGITLVNSNVFKAVFKPAFASLQLYWLGEVSPRNRD